VVVAAVESGGDACLDLGGYPGKERAVHPRFRRNRVCYRYPMSLSFRICVVGDSGDFRVRVY
jgi:hypothetical protein